MGNWLLFASYPRGGALRCSALDLDLDLDLDLVFVLLGVVVF